jgi:hypothetical protein
MGRRAGIFFLFEREQPSYFFLIELTSSYFRRIRHFYASSILQVPARKLYEKNGFREVGRDKYQDLEVILYEKQLE